MNSSANDVQIYTRGKSKPACKVDRQCRERWCMLEWHLQGNGASDNEEEVEQIRGDADEQTKQVLEQMERSVRQDERHRGMDSWGLLVLGFGVFWFMVFWSQCLVNSLFPFVVFCFHILIPVICSFHIIVLQ